jgi:FkbM family methyltransferase
MKKIGQKLIDSIVGISFLANWYKINEWKLAIDFYQFLKYKKFNDASELNRFISKKGSVISLSFNKFGYQYIEINLNDTYLLDILYEFLFDNAYELDQIKFDPAWVIDCGTYRGFFTFKALKKFEKSNFICIEPHPKNFLELKNSFTKIKSNGILLINKAISPNSGFIDFFQSGTFGAIDGLSRKNDTTSIETIDLVAIIEGKKDIILKIDIEGAELQYFPEIIESFPDKCAVFLETHDSWDSLNEIQRVFQENGFSFYVIRERGQFIDSFFQRIKV